MVLLDKLNYNCERPSTDNALDSVTTPEDQISKPQIDFNLTLSTPYK
nr:13144_t:CDS:2 [Entrophospora candida]